LSHDADTSGHLPIVNYLFTRRRCHINKRISMSSDWCGQINPSQKPILFPLEVFSTLDLNLSMWRQLQLISSINYFLRADSQWRRQL